ncbi:MAG TPA: LysR substrate-binding domain-containing protein [Mizugakiibacter sp.]
MSRAPLMALQAFVLAARTGNLSRAAAQMNLTVSALSHQIRGLEERLGRRLFERGPRGVAPTADGSRLLDLIGVPLESIEHALQQYHAPRHNALTVSLMPSMASGWLVPRLPRFVARHPQIELSLQSNGALVDFDREPVDLAMRYGPGQWPGVQAEHLFDEWLTPVASPALLQRLGRPKLHELGQWPLLGDPSGSWKEWFELYGGQPPRRFVTHFSDREALQRAASEGLGVAMIRLTMARPLLDNGMLVTLFDERMRSQYQHYLVYPPRMRGQAAFEAFRAWMLEEARVYAAAEHRANAPRAKSPPPLPAPKKRARR